MVDKEKAKRDARIRRHNKVRSQVSGTAEVPRLNVFRGNKGLFVQLIDDLEGKTLASVSDAEIKDAKTKIEVAKEAGKMIAKKAQEKNIKRAVFDRGGYRYHGRVKAVADGAREGGLEF
ncbi:MAG: 50S ribosomal protein L18 [Candidatus Pacebacteria bacterium]|nr:50S ribosomal protein L18 [Candidatus Paceibacterota bacterium]